FSGVVEAVGQQVTQFKQGDQLFGPTTIKMGAYAGYLCLPASHPLAIMPPGMSFDEAATIAVGGANALHFVRHANIKPQQKMLIIGAGGSIGTYSLQLAKLKGAEVTAVDSANKLEMLHSIGADHTIDYTKEDFGKNAKTYDLILDIVGTGSFLRNLNSLKSGGNYLMANPNKLSMIVQGLWVSWFGKKKVTMALASMNTADMTHVAELIVAGKIKPAIDKRYPLEQVADAHRYVEAGHKKGSVVVNVT
ncbi:MAG: NAD(P)-dependent alcohol dehydrogenase, partial [Bacteroidales bacterium]|nr:NAD(P)-dependent alcohol dehydrogenase [Bacteroidales bacterium]